MGGALILAVSTPCNEKGKPSGYRLIHYADGGLSTLPCRKEDQKADVDINVQAFCYLKPKERTIVPACINDTLLDSSDYMILAKSSGFVEIVKDFQYKTQNDLPLDPSFVLRCTPEGNPDFRCDSMVAGLQYREGLLYCCLCSGKIYIYVLNLPHDYVQTEKSVVRAQSPDPFYSSLTSVDRFSSNQRYMEEGTFYKNMKYTGRSRLKHICYYLLPMEPNHLRVSAAMFLFGHCYRDIAIYKPSIFVEVDQGVTAFRINPLDPFSFFTVSPRSALIIRKIMLPMAYVDFFTAFVTKKKIIQDARPEEIKSWNRIAKEKGHDSLVSWILEDPVHDISNLATFFWEDLARYDAISIQRTIIVWIQKQGRVKDDIYRLFRQGEIAQNDDDSRRSSVAESTESETRRLTRHGFDGGAPRPPVDLPRSMNWELGPFVRDVGRNTFTADFEVVQSTMDASGDEQDRDDDDGVTRTSFLTDNYKNMDIVCIDRYSSLSIFRPKHLDVALKKVDFLQYCMRYKHSERSEVGNEQLFLQRALSRFTSFKKLFMLTESLCMVLDTNGVLLIDRHALSETTTQMQTVNQTVKVATFNIGLVSDAVLVVKKLEEEDHGSFEVVYDLIVTCIPGHILAFEGKFVPKSSLGELVLRDSMRLKRKNRFVDQICLVHYECPQGKKRSYSLGTNGPVVIKRTKWE